VNKNQLEASASVVGQKTNNGTGHKNNNGATAYGMKIN